jgi:acyl-CoA synthetase (AMP-forming)/AMP-acid ligase II
VAASVYPARSSGCCTRRPGSRRAVVAIPTSGWAKGRDAIQLRDGATADEDELRAYCLANLARYKVPERWLFVDDFPRNSMGKIQRRELPALFTP